MISFLHSHFSFAGLLKFVFVYLANTAVLCYSLTIICCCHVQNYIYWIISTENDHRRHHKFIKYEKRLRKEGKMVGLPINNNQAKSLSLQREILTRSTSLSSLHPMATVQLIPYTYPAFVPLPRKILHFYSSLSLNPSKSASYHRYLWTGPYDYVAHFFFFFSIDFFSYKQHFATFYVSLYDIYTINTIKQ